MRETVFLKCCGTASEIIIGPSKSDLPGLLPAEPGNTVIITDANVHRNNRGFVDAHKNIIVGQGESIKTLKTVEEVCSRLIELDADRDTFLLGMGGGVITDITGLAAGLFMRGVRFGFVATTLLGQVDACIGGKDGVNLDGYKNIVGLFNQPEIVVCDTEQITTLPEREFKAGLAEIIKTAIIGDPELFRILERHDPERLRDDAGLLQEIIVRAVKVKAGIVERDEREKGERRKLNLGHTFAHAAEKNIPGLSHGEAVAAGTAIACRIAAKMGKLSENEGRRIISAIEKAGLPTGYPIELKKLFSAIRHDKKRYGDIIHIIVPAGIGECEVVGMPLSELEEMSV